MAMLPEQLTFMESEELRHACLPVSVAPEFRKLLKFERKVSSTTACQMVFHAPHVLFFSFFFSHKTTETNLGPWLPFSFQVVGLHDCTEYMKKKKWKKKKRKKSCALVENKQF